MHPREQARPFWSFGVDRISKMRASDATKLSAAKQEDGLVRLTVDSRTGHDVFWISPSEGYCVVQSKSWRLGSNEEEQPLATYEGTFREVPNGAFVLARRALHETRFVDGIYRPSRDEELTLLEIEMRDQLDPERFTLDGLGLPPGAIIHDALRGRQYEYGVPAVAESEIETPAPGGALTGRWWLWTIYAAVGVALVATLAYRVRRGRRRAVDNSAGARD